MYGRWLKLNSRAGKGLAERGRETARAGKQGEGVAEGRCVYGVAAAGIKHLFHQENPSVAFLLLP